jgi:hypothetical protein
VRCGPGSRRSTPVAYVIEVRGRRISVRARRAEGDEAERVHALFVRQNAGAVTTARFTAREIPVVVLEPAARPDRP